MGHTVRESGGPVAMVLTPAYIGSVTIVDPESRAHFGKLVLRWLSTTCSLFAGTAFKDVGAGGILFVLAIFLFLSQ